MVYRKKFIKFLAESFLSDHEAAMYLGCATSTLALWKSNENTAPKESVHHLEEYIDKLAPFYAALKDIFENKNIEARHEETAQMAVEKIVQEMQRAGLYHSTITNVLSDISSDMKNEFDHIVESHKENSDPLPF